ncbi:hypothetical protein CRYUN_Cryun07bG0089800 [Craigia yunnanensis]
MWNFIRRRDPKIHVKRLLKPYVNHRHFRTRAVDRQNASPTGLYGFDHLKSPEGFKRFVDDAIESSGELVDYISGMPSSAEIIRAMDEISDTGHRRSVLLLIPRNTVDKLIRPDIYKFCCFRGFVEEANKATMRINEYLHFLNTNHTLYNAVKKAEQDGHLLTEEARRAALHLRIDFEKGGIHLPSGKLDRVNQLNLIALQLCREKMAYLKGNFVLHANPKVLDKLIDSRRELAQLMRKFEASFRKIISVTGLEDDVFEQQDQDLLLGSDLEPWDEAYYTAMMKSSAYSLDSSVVASYFFLPQCIEGLKLLVKSLFGANFVSVPMAPGESWHPHVLKMCLHHSEEGDLGSLYVDLYSRKGKYPGCATFAIKGGRKISDTEYQLPVMALVFNFSRSHDSSTVRLNHGELETLFHEFGHALHALLSRTDYQHFSGTRVALDFAETPSHLFEYYARDYRVLRKFARHHSTGEVIPEKLVKSLNGARDVFATTELQRQIFYTLVDQTLFGEQLPVPRDSSSIVAHLKRQHSNEKHVEGTHMQLRFTHFLTYGAGNVTTATCMPSVLPRGSSITGNRNSAQNKTLQHGGAKEPADLLTDLVGDGIVRYHNGGIVPDITSLKEVKLLDKRKTGLFCK